MRLSEMSGTPAGNGSGVEVGYRVEARSSIFVSTNPYVVNGQIITEQWSTLRFVKGLNPAGVPEIDDFPGATTHLHDLLPYESALALAHTVIAQHQQYIGLSLRLVAYRLETTYKLERLGLVEGEISHNIGLPKIKEDENAE